MSTDDGDAKLPPTGRFTRFRKLATLGARMGTDVVAQGVKRFTSGEQSLLSKGAAETLVSVLGEMKGAAMKVGQMVALDDELLTPEIRKVIARLQNQAPPMPFSTVEQVILPRTSAAPPPRCSPSSSAPRSPPRASARSTAARPTTATRSR